MLGRSRHSLSHEEKTRCTGDTHNSAPQATAKKTRPEKTYNSQHGPHTTRKGTNGHVTMYIMYITVSLIGLIPMSASASQLNYIYNIIYLSPVPTALHCPFLRSTTAHALHSRRIICFILISFGTIVLQYCAIFV